MAHLDTTDHDRGSAGLTYVYPVVSRRSRGVSIGINLNPNRACNWRCVYCQVEGLVFGKGPEIDLAQLERELEGLLADVLEGDFMQRRVPEEARALRDVAFSGDGEPTSSPRFEAAVEVVVRVLERRGLTGSVELVLITNGSLIQKPGVQAGLERLAAAGGVAWYKLDAATDAGLASVNDARSGVARARANLERCAALCPTWIQTMVFARAGEPPAEAEQAAYLALLADLTQRGVPLRGVLLYGLARPSHQPEAAELSALPRAWLDDLARRIEALGLPVRVHA